MRLKHKIKIEWAQEGKAVRATGYRDGKKIKSWFYPVVGSLGQTIKNKAPLVERYLTPRNIPVRMVNTGQKMSFETFCRLRELENEKVF